MNVVTIPLSLTLLVHKHGTMPWCHEVLVSWKEVTRMAALESYQTQVKSLGNRVETKLKKRGIMVSCKLYKNARHEILNDFTYEAVRNDIFDFCNKCD